MEKNKDLFQKRTSYLFGGLSKVGFVAIVLGIFVLISPYFLDDDNSTVKAIITGIITMLTGFILSFSYEGITFDFNKKIYRKYFSFLGFRIGQWQSIPDFKSVRVIGDTLTYNTTSNGVNPSYSGKTKIYSVGLFTTNPKPEVYFKSENKEEILRDATYLSQKLNADLIAKTES
jgi:hypothetical protein